MTAALLGSVALVLALPAVAQDAPVAPPADNAPPPAEEAPSPANNAPVPATTAPVSPASPSAETAAPTPAPITNRVVRSITIVGNERLEPETVRSYLGLAVGDSYDRNRLDNALKALFATDLFGADTFIRDRNGDLTVEVQENPVVNRIIL
ncbi:MAG: POTRA domain-containing protein, partial [Pseudomonadota bacterium]